MSAIVLVDTSVFLNVLDVPGFNQDRDIVLVGFDTRIRSGQHFLLPMATVWETGNHISRLPTGGLRREFATRLVEQVRRAVTGEAPYRATYLPERDEFLIWINEFPDHAMRNKSPTKTNCGVSLADLSIIKEWERTRSINSMSRVLIWSLDGDLAGYDTGI